MHDGIAGYSRYIGHPTSYNMKFKSTIQPKAAIDSKNKTKNKTKYGLKIALFGHNTDSRKLANRTKTH